MEVPLEPREEKQETGWGAPIAIAIVIVVVAAGGLYFFYEQKRARALENGSQAQMYVSNTLC